MPAIPLNLTIPADKAEAAVAAFVRMHPNRSDGAMTDEEWLVAFVRDWLDAILQRGNEINDRATKYTPPSRDTFLG